MEKGYFNYYQMLGIVPQVHPDAIAEAVNRKLKELRENVTDPDEHQRLAKEVYNARTILLNHEKREAYNKAMGLDAVPKTYNPEDYNIDQETIWDVIIKLLDD